MPPAFIERRQLAHGVGELGAHLVACAELHLLDLALGFRNRRLDAGDLGIGLITIAAQARQIALQPQDLDLGHGAGAHQGTGGIELLLQQGHATLGLLLARARLVELLLPLRQLVARHRDLGRYFLAPGLEQAALMATMSGASRSSSAED